MSSLPQLNMKGGVASLGELVRCFDVWTRIQTSFNLHRCFRINVEKHLAYIVLPRCGHQSVCMFLCGLPGGFVEKLVYDRHSKALIDGCTVFGIIRNPITRFVSTYVMINVAEGYSRRQGHPGIGPLVQSMPYWRIADPKARLRQYLRDITRHGLYDPHIMPQTYWLDMGVHIDKHIIFEHFSDHMRRFLSERGIDLALFPRTNPSVWPERTRHLCKILTNDAECLSLFRNLYRCDCVLYHKLTGVDPAKGEYHEGEWTYKDKIELWSKQGFTPGIDRRAERAVRRQGQQK